MVRFCKICNIEKEIKSGKICNKCKSIKYKENTKKYYLDNKDNIKNAELILFSFLILSGLIDCIIC